MMRMGNGSCARIERAIQRINEDKNKGSHIGPENCRRRSREPLLHSPLLDFQFSGPNIRRITRNDRTKSLSHILIRKMCNYKRWGRARIYSKSRLQKDLHKTYIKK
eukprot:TRINITY_DN13414_c0_g1_i1.p1 TRINITY_DN13414_c0_g1~~TRINITY_DN13414_c0_g1_i1.p1  ORF type:complete len:106 (-),score=7.27 TRINITY_DN13414_c0_g1_i1:120-437(-)